MKVGERAVKSLEKFKEQYPNTTLGDLQTFVIGYRTCEQDYFGSSVPEEELSHGGTRQCDVRSPEGALVFLADCQLATVTELAVKKSRGKYDFDRQVSIAKLYCKWLSEFGISAKGTRVETAMSMGGVDEFVKRYDAKQKEK